MSEMLSPSEEGSTRLWRVTFGHGRAHLAEFSRFKTSNLKFEILYLPWLLALDLGAFAPWWIHIRVYRLARRSLGEGGCSSVAKISVFGTRPLGNVPSAAKKSHSSQLNPPQPD
jgi:hypothetical protein